MAGLKPPEQTLRSRLSFRPMFYEANDHPRHAINTQPGRSNPEHPLYWYTFNISCFPQKSRLPFSKAHQWQNCRTSQSPQQTAASPERFWSPMFSSAFHGAPACMRFALSSAKVENVVKAPRKPTSSTGA